MGYEDRATETVEEQTSKLPSIAFLGFAVASMIASAALLLTGRKQLGNFVGHWAPTILIMGLYNKVAKEIAVPRRHGRGANAGRGMGAGMQQGTLGAGANAGAGV
jgi:hypothetical protein